MSPFKTPCIVLFVHYLGVSLRSPFVSHEAIEELIVSRGQSGFPVGLLREISRVVGIICLQNERVHS